MRVGTALYRVGLVGGVTLGRLVGTVAMFAMIARAAGPAPFAALTYWYAISVMAAAVTEYGFSQHLLSTLPRETGERRDALVHEALGAKYWLIVAASIVTIGCAAWTSADWQETAMAALLVAGAMVGSASELNSMILRALGGFKADSWTSLVSGLMASLAAGAVGMMGDHLLWAAFALAAVRVLGVVLQRVAIRRLTGLTIPLWPRWRNVRVALAGLKSSATNGADNVAIQLLLNFDVLACRVLLDPIQAGLYLSANRLINAANAGFPVLTSVFLPAIVEGPDAPAGRRAMTLLAIAGVGVAVSFNLVMWTLHEPIARILFGAQFVRAGDFLGPLALAVGLRYLSLAASVKLIVLRRQIWKAAATLLSIAAGAVALRLNYEPGALFDVNRLVVCVIGVCAAQSAAHIVLAHWLGRETSNVPNRVPA